MNSYVSSTNYGSLVAKREGQHFLWHDNIPPEVSVPRPHHQLDTHVLCVFGCRGKSLSLERTGCSVQVHQSEASFQIVGKECVGAIHVHDGHGHMDGWMQSHLLRDNSRDTRFKISLLLLCVSSSEQIERVVDNHVPGERGWHIWKPRVTHTSHNHFLTHMQCSLRTPQKKHIRRSRRKNKHQKCRMISNRVADCIPEVDEHDLKYG